MRIDWLDLSDINAPGLLDDFCRRALPRVDKTRREKAARIRGSHEKVLSLGAGLLLQRMTARWQGEAETAEPRIFKALELLEHLEASGAAPTELTYRFGEHGKPELADFPLHFSLSHSGDYVLCVCSDEPIGADIQQIRTDIDIRRLAERFFPEAEREAVLQIMDETARRTLFFRLWTRREAYAKLTGEGLPPVIDRPLPENLAWTELAPPDGYAAIACSRR